MDKADFTAEEARALIESEEAKIDQRCLAEIRQVLARYGRELRGVPALIPNSTGAFLLDARVELVRTNR